MPFSSSQLYSLLYNHSLLPPSTLFKIHDVSPPAHQSELGAPSVYCFIDFYRDNFLAVCLQLCLHREPPFSYIPFCSFSLPAGAILAPMLHAIQSTFSVLHRFQITMCLCLSKTEKPQQRNFVLFLKCVLDGAVYYLQKCFPEVRQPMLFGSKCNASR